MMNPGEYYIGDLCYVMHDKWEEFCDITINGDNVVDGEFTLKDGTRFATFTTKWGDGCYMDQEGREYSVDAGLIGCILVSDISAEEKKNIRDGHVVTFDYPFAPYKTESGVIRFLDVAIDTDPADDDYEDDYDYEEDEHAYDDE